MFISRFLRMNLDIRLECPMIFVQIETAESKRVELIQEKIVLCILVDVSIGGPEYQEPIKVISKATKKYVSN